MKFGILLSGCGVYDGAEIHEATMAMLAIKESGHDYQCISVDKNQYHVVNHLTGEEMNETRNVMVESARIARGDIKEISEINPSDIDALVIPGGFGSAKNFSTWAFSGPEGEIDPKVKLLIVNMVNVGKPICALCVSPVVVAKALQGSDVHANLTLGTDAESSPYDIPGFNAGIESVGAVAEMKTVREILVDHGNNIVTAPCYMMDADILEVRNNVKQAIEATIKLM
ncbi:isoprenoid biosynthesis glyoxalase ElbB [Paracrocinitomix mangrovi]|uniref:isoprenoid biosynthesis glyoxalase ElbB n=1 Tax=Paracrocinitomix mangrovi TaxID=2862509 RepID=UPI001C8CF3A1|nr:isoprenoid biosynthesis glyoxalase ElbB [Paracrocinitomix mangrovi]UKN02172.1 isoprenoid biosynthesis glyoxalase ElbB [Paracrocinitomix mangrovi]